MLNRLGINSPHCCKVFLIFLIANSAVSRSEPLALDEPLTLEPSEAVMRDELQDPLLKAVYQGLPRLRYAVQEL
jgi:hypothetical protein